MSLADLFKPVLRSAIYLITAAIACAPAALFAQSPNLAGTWEMDAAKSQVSDGRSMLLVITTAANKIKIDAKIRDKSGQEKTAGFTCAPDGKECEFDEGGHKSKVSLWFSGDALNVAKTDGPAGDVVNEWKLQTSSQGKVLTLTINHIDPSGPDETFVFAKKT